MKIKISVILLMLCLLVWGYYYSNENNANNDDTLISFNDDIRPILNKSCTGCHGGVGKQSNVSFIYREEALARGHSGRLTIVPGDPDASELIVRVESNDPNIRMPYKAPALPEHEIALLRQWIEEGAQWEEHWAFIKPKQHPIPKVKNNTVINNEIDAFIESNLEKKGLSLADKATKTALLRRLSFDLNGLPPTVEEIEAFLADTSVTAYENQVDRLLASKRYGERWAAMWMDLSRYADSHGFTRDEYRDTWPYKQWGIESLNDNKSYKNFMIEQLAGDLMPNRSLDNIIATGFHRQTPSNSEGGTDDEEYRMVAVMDRSATTWSVLNAMTMNCVQCHSHPYDPIQHEEYYTSLSFFNTSKDADYRDYQPLYKLATQDDQKQQAFTLQEQLMNIRQQEAEKAYSLNQQTANSWEKLAITSVLGDEVRGIQLYLNSLLDEKAALKKEGKELNYRKVALIKVAQDRIKELSDNNQNIRTYQVKDGELLDEGSHEARVILAVNTETATANQLINNIKFIATPQQPEKSQHTPEKAFSIDDIKIFIVNNKGEKSQVAITTFMSSAPEVIDDQLTQLAKLPLDNNGLRTGLGSGFFAHRIFLPRWTVAVLTQPITLAAGERLLFELDQMQLRDLNTGMPSRLHRLTIETSSTNLWQDYALSEKRQQHLTQYAQLKDTLNTIEGVEMPVMLEQEPWDQRKMAKFNRGNMIAKVGEILKPGTPAIFPEFNESADRLGLAQWFFTADQPLTARVAVNRFWHRLFGIGIVESLEDFGSAGTQPMHPELLDWLAITFQHDYKWDMKALLKLMVMSHTYQQDATIKPEILERDPQNQWFSRGPRQRLTAEMIRDQALTASDTIHHHIGGEPVMPPQPEGIWGHPGKVIKEWQDANDNNRYRRAIYTFIKRAFMYPSFLTFDMETREFSHERRIATNTPLQALVTLNDPVYHEAAQALGKLMSHQGSATNDSEAVKLGFKRVVSRLPQEKELASLLFALKEIRTEVSSTTTNQAKTVNSTWTAMASILLNLDSALTR